jgi:hypothetical protein
MENEMMDRGARHTGTSGKYVCHYMHADRSVKYFPRKRFLTFANDGYTGDISMHVIMYRICLVDDKAYGIPQVIRAIPEGIMYEFYYFDRAADLDRTVDYDVIILDFYLDKEGKTALDFIDSLSAWPVIAFSSDDAKNDLVVER